MHDRAVLANKELHNLVQRIQERAWGTSIVSREDFEAFLLRLLNMPAEVGDAARSEILDSNLQIEIGEYVTSLRVLMALSESILG